ncbi:MAG: fluoride efflux transporter CrcB [Cyclobacteriaceae bacterium]|nr:fluoride efflux transporter CrcB [Cyclobacteriaceae bacterium]MCB9237077.1 fluoride efflux transporter CrcB [Flammeovirgaceae bacterium]MCB0500195.1 fluoride efflux transporter CrcB [Cyclobacteriaceae bacterium]MCO5271724.1 fluoride efflux transporter CrcB [Cyclobacteriaceae bacterium]MCW5901212.1 fluoride efflux transporter CrcB [Cyclobacteriaceae bacterium]
MKTAFLVFLGGGIGSLARYSLGKWIGTLHTHYFPFGTLVANILACFALGVVLGLADTRQLLSPSAKIFWAVGFCGGFSTFSTFSGEALSLAQSGFTGSSMAYVLASLLACIAAILLGLYLGQGT